MRLTKKTNNLHKETQKCSTKRIHKMRLTKIFHKNDSQKKRTNKGTNQQTNK